jgi:hypothetical protein
MRQILRIKRGPSLRSLTHRSRPRQKLPVFSPSVRHTVEIITPWKARECCLNMFAIPIVVGLSPTHQHLVSVIVTIRSKL